MRMLNGYRVMYRPEHPNAMSSKNWKGYIYEHILIAERMMGRPLRKEEVVHHLNEDKADNRESNLLVLEHGQHTKLHNWLKGALGERSTSVNEVKTEKSKSVRYCSICSLTLKNSQKKYCSAKCSSIGCRAMKKRPSKSELKTLIDNNSWSAIGRMYGVSCNAVRKWEKIHELI